MSDTGVSVSVCDNRLAGITSKQLASPHPLGRGRLQATPNAVDSLTATRRVG